MKKEIEYCDRETYGDILKWSCLVGLLSWDLKEQTLEEEMATHSSNSCLANPMGRGAWWGTVHGITKSQTQLSLHTS